MTVGETLTEARSQAGLTVDELSERTRIRGTVIRSIEQDDFAACGGDLYVRGYVRAIAGAVGIDAQPLIREYELSRAAEDSERASGSTGRHAKGFPRVADAPTAFDLPPVPVEPAGPAGPGATRFDLPQVTGDPAVTSYDLPAVPAIPPAAVPPGSADTRFDLPPITDDLMAPGHDLGPQPEPGQLGDATAVLPSFGQDAGAPQAFLPPPGGAQFHAVPPVAALPGTPRRNRRAVLVAVVALAAVIALGALVISLASGGSSGAGAAAASASAAAARASAAAQASASAASASAAAQASASASASAAAQASASAAAKASAAGAVIRLPIAAAQAFGPDGFADGDDPGNASSVIGGASQPWSTQWYATPQFGMLKHGTGLLLDMGGKVTVTSVVIALGQYGGADLEIRAGNGTAPQDLSVAATASNVGGVVRVTLHRPVTARYLLIWFTQLPPNGSGQYQETVSHVQVTGRR